MPNPHLPRHHPQRTRRPHHPTRRVSWCCPFSAPPQSPQNPNPKRLEKAVAKSVSGSYLNSPHRVNLVNRILSPGRVSPINPDPTPVPSQEVRVSRKPPSPITNRIETQLKFDCFEKPKSSSGEKGAESWGIFDVRLNLKGKRGGLVLELNSGVLSANSSVFADLIEDYRRGSSCSGVNLVRIEVPEVENLFVFRETIELMFEEGEEGVLKKLMKLGVYRCIDILEVSANIKFMKAVNSCLKYLEAVPWSEEEEEKLRTLFNKLTFDNSISRDILARLSSLDSENSQQNLTKHLIWSITSSTNPTARNELKSLVKALLQKSSVYETTQAGIEIDDLYAICHSCLESLKTLFKEASGLEKVPKKDSNKPLLERISTQVDNINWVLEVLLDRQSAEEFVKIWGEQKELLKMHENASPMVRYELSRVSAMLFIAIGARKLHCRSESRVGFLRSWFSPMLSDFGWLKRCKKGLEIKNLEDSMGQSLLTLPLENQYDLFMEWFQRFSKGGNEVPNLSKAFQIWWRRSVLRGSESRAVESR